MNSVYRIDFPEYFDDYATEIEAKGYFDDLTVDAGHARYKPLFYDTVRLRQESRTTWRAALPRSPNATWWCCPK